MVGCVYSCISLFTTIEQSAPECGVSHSANREEQTALNSKPTLSPPLLMLDDSDCSAPESISLSLLIPFSSSSSHIPPPLRSKIHISFTLHYFPIDYVENLCIIFSHLAFAVSIYFNLVIPSGLGCIPTRSKSIPLNCVINEMLLQGRMEWTIAALEKELNQPFYVPLLNVATTPAPALLVLHAQPENTLTPCFCKFLKPKM